jgi:hypothetical protein
LSNAVIDARLFRIYNSEAWGSHGGFNSLLDGGQMSFPTEQQQQTQLELEGLKRTLEWTEIQREQLLDRLDLLRLENARLQDRVEELERRIDNLKQQQPLF